jgi:uncharacterized protein with PIN domain
VLRFLIDTQLPPLLSILLNQWGYDSIHTTHFPDGHLLNDKAIREIAINNNRIIVTKDSDFYDYYHVKGSTGDDHYLQYFIRLFSSSIKQLPYFLYLFNAAFTSG